MDTATKLFIYPTVVTCILSYVIFLSWFCWKMAGCPRLSDSTLWHCWRAWRGGMSVSDILRYRRECTPLDYPRVTLPTTETPMLPAPNPVCSLPSPRMSDTMANTVGATPRTVGRVNVDVSVPSSTRPRGYRGAEVRRPRVHIDVAVPSSTRVRPPRKAQWHAKILRTLSAKDLFLL
jgi:hypothetical protein